MISTPTVDIVGLDTLASDWQRAWANGGPLDKAMQKAGGQAIEPLASVVRSAVPQQSGRLAATVRTRQLPTGQAVSMGDSGTRYAGWIEFGGWRRAPHESYRDYDSRGRYLFPNAIPLASSAVPLYEHAIQQGLDGYGWTNQ